MTPIKVQWHTFKLTPEDTRAEITRKLVKKDVDLLDLPNSVYVIRLSTTFIIEYTPQKESPVVYIGQGSLRGRLNSHRKWLSKLQELLPNAPFEVAFCFPRDRKKNAVNEEFEAHLLSHFSKKFGQLPLRNRKHERRVRGLEFDKQGRQQVLGHGIGKKYTWAIKPRESKVPFTKFTQ